MKQSEAKDFLPLIQAWAEGKTLQYNTGRCWIDLEYSTFSHSASDYRIKPEPKLRPWRPEEVPVRALARSKARASEVNAWMIVEVIVGISQTNIYLGHGHCYSPEELSARYEHSLDHGKTWQPCGVLE